MDIKIDKKSKTPVYVQIVNQLKLLIQRDEINRGATLPSERALSKILGVHRNTIIKAYNELKAEDYIESRQGVGYIVNFGKEQKSGAAPVASLGEASVRRTPKKVNWTYEIKDEFLDREKAYDNLFQRYSDDNKYALSSGFSMPSVYRKSVIADDIADIIAYEGKTQYFYSPYKGDENLRQRIVSFLSTKGIKASTGEIQVVTETNQAIDFIANLLINPGDAVILPEPVSPDTYRTLMISEARIYTVPVNDHGMDIKALGHLMETVRPKAVFIDSSFHDPTATCIDNEGRNEIIALSNKFRIPVVEIDAASELVYEGERIMPIKALDTMNNVIYVYSFSLTFTPGLSLAFIVADKEVIRSLSYIVSVRFVATDWMTQKLMARYLEDGTYYRNIEVFIKNYREKRDLVAGYLDGLSDCGVSYMKPRGGVYIWCRLPEGTDCKEFVKEAYARDLLLIPGYIFYPFKNGGRDYVRINYSFEHPDKIEEGMKIFCEMIREIAAKN